MIRRDNKSDRGGGGTSSSSSSFYLGKDCSNPNLSALNIILAKYLFESASFLVLVSNANVNMF